MTKLYFFKLFTYHWNPPYNTNFIMSRAKDLTELASHSALTDWTKVLTRHFLFIHSVDGSLDTLNLILCIRKINSLMPSWQIICFLLWSISSNRSIIQIWLYWCRWTYLRCIFKSISVKWHASIVGKTSKNLYKVFESALRRNVNNNRIADTFSYDEIFLKLNYRLIFVQLTLLWVLLLENFIP